MQLNLIKTTVALDSYCGTALNKTFHIANHCSLITVFQRALQKGQQCIRGVGKQNIESSYLRVESQNLVFTGKAVPFFHTSNWIFPKHDTWKWAPQTHQVFRWSFCSNLIQIWSPIDWTCLTGVTFLQVQKCNAEYLDQLWLCSPQSHHHL